MRVRVRVKVRVRVRVKCVLCVQDEAVEPAIVDLLHARRPGGRT